MALPIREILDTDDLYRRFAANHIRRDGSLSPTAFMKRSASKGLSIPDPEISVDLADLTTPELSLQRAGRPDEPDGKPNQGIVALAASLLVALLLARSSFAMTLSKRRRSARRTPPTRSSKATPAMARWRSVIDWQRLATSAY